MQNASPGSNIPSHFKDKLFGNDFQNDIDTMEEVLGGEGGGQIGRAGHSMMIPVIGEKFKELSSKSFFNFIITPFGERGL